MTDISYTYLSAKKFLKDEFAYYQCEWFQTREHFEEFLQKLKSHGVKKIFVSLDNGNWDGALLLRIPKKITPELLVAVADEKPDECHFETHNDEKFIRLWWD
jgi:hypothetical protein